MHFKKIMLATTVLLSAVGFAAAQGTTIGNTSTADTTLRVVGLPTETTTNYPNVVIIDSDGDMAQIAASSIGGADDDVTAVNLNLSGTNLEISVTEGGAAIVDATPVALADIGAAFPAASIPVAAIDGAVGGNNTDVAAALSAAGVLNVTVTDGGGAITDDDNVNLAGIEPWFGTDNSAGATLNTEDIYSLGRVGVGTSTIGANLHVGSGGALENIILGNFADTGVYMHTVPTVGSETALIIGKTKGTREFVLEASDATNVSMLKFKDDAAVEARLFGENGNFGIHEADPVAELQIGDGPDAGTSVLFTVGDDAGQRVYQSVNTGALGMSATGNISATGNSASLIAIGSTDSSYLDLNTTSNRRVLIEATPSLSYVRLFDNAGIASTIYGDGGNFEHSGTFTGVSDARLKENVLPLSLSADFLTNIQPVTYEWIEGDDATHAGFIAQNVQDVLPNAVRTRNDEMGTLSVEPIALIAALTVTAKSQQAEIEALKSQLEDMNALQLAVAEMQSQMAALFAGEGQVLDAGL